MPSRQEAPDPSSAGALAVGEVARRVGVSVSTILSWERRYGLGAGGRTSGGHRRYDSADLQALLQVRAFIEGGMPTANAARAAMSRPTRPRSKAPAGRRLPARREKFETAIEALDPSAAGRAADAMLASDGAAASWNDSFVPFLQQLGSTWRADGSAIEQEHLAVIVLQAALDRFALERYPQHRRGRRLSTLAAATANERHTLPLHALVAGLAEHRLGAGTLGALPPPALRTAIDTLRPTVVVLWARSPRTSDPGQLRELLDAAPVVIAAGTGWRLADLPTRVPCPRDLRTAIDAVRAWLQ